MHKLISISAKFEAGQKLFKRKTLKPSSHYMILKRRAELCGSNYMTWTL